MGSTETALTVIPARAVALQQAVSRWQAELTKVSPMDYVVYDAVCGKMNLELMAAIDDELLSLVMSLMGVDGGFAVDRAYPPEKIRQLWAYCAIRGIRMTGNEVAIISAKVHICKNYYLRALRETPGLSEHSIYCGPPKRVGDDAEILVRVGFSLHRSVKRFETVVSVATKGGATTDTLHGKATRKALSSLVPQLREGFRMAEEVEGITRAAHIIDEDQRDPRVLLNDRGMEADAVRSHAAAEGSQDGPELSGPALAELFQKTIAAASSLAEMEEIRPELIRAATESRISRDLSSQTWAVFHARVKELEKIGA